ncbi:MAG: hypothetical protein QF593_00700, partial [Nitrospinota bacterium]|nr:hypothetical protein [Nitrospinota bacterium]
MLTEESFHGSGGGYAGNWAAAMGADMLFAIVESRKGDFDSDDDIDFADFMEFVDVHGLTDADPGWNDDVRIGDFNDDGGIDLSDFTLFTDAYGT